MLDATKIRADRYVLDSTAMFVGAFAAHSGFSAMNDGMEYPLTLAVITAALVLIGPGRLAYSLPKKAR